MKTQDLPTIITGDALVTLQQMDAESVDCCVTSPPYWGLRDYKNEGQIGLEKTPDEYVEQLVAVFREVKRVLKPTGTLWLNLGDSYTGSRAGPAGKTGFLATRSEEQRLSRTRTGEAKHKLSGTLKAGDLPTKSLVGVPWRVAFALQADGWILRSDIIWAKGVSFNEQYSGSCMPESVRDRPTKAHEHLFLLTKQPQYYYDLEGVKETSADPIRVRADRIGGASHEERQQHSPGGMMLGSAQRNIRDVWTINPKPFPGAHFAVMPPKLVEPCVKAGSSEYGVCVKCGAPWTRQVDRTKVPDRPGRNQHIQDTHLVAAHEDDRRAGSSYTGVSTTLNWEPTCSCDINAVLPAVVLDPFAGAGTVPMVATRLRRRSIGIELNPEYAELAKERIRKDARCRPSLWDLTGGR